MDRKSDFVQMTQTSPSEEEIYRRKNELLVRAVAAAEAMDQAAALTVATHITERAFALPRPKEPLMYEARPRNCGQIRGSLDELRPFFLLARPGASRRELKARMSDKAQGIFVVNILAGNGVCPQIGLLLPVGRCKNPDIRATLEKLCEFLSTSTAWDAPMRRTAAQALLDDELGGALRIEPKAALDSYLSLEPGRGIFSLFSEHFEYVDEFMDDPGGSAVPTQFRSFPWQGYGEFLEWLYDREAHSHNSWNLCHLYLMYDRVTDLVPDFGNARAEIMTPDFNPGKYFRIAPEVTDLHVEVRMRVGEAGWDYLAIAVAADEVRIRISGVYPPYEVMLQWAQMVSRGDVPAEFDIDEEGTDKRLCAMATEDPERVWFRVIDPYDNMKVFVEGIVNRRQLAEAFEEELVRFFRMDFDARHFPEQLSLAKMVKAGLAHRAKSRAQEGLRLHDHAGAG
jgi:hypothetical protein